MRSNSLKNSAVRSENKEAVIFVPLAPKIIIDQVFNSPTKPAIIIDAIFGIGVRGHIEGFYLRHIDKINHLRVTVISIDVPSGLDADSGKALGIAITATRTVTLGCPKKGFRNASAKPYLGELIVADIGLPNEQKETDI